MPLILQEALRGLFYAPFYVALARDAFAAEGVEIQLHQLAASRQDVRCASWTARSMCAGADRCG